ncbi:MAG TPA: hypothetical protein VLV76_12960 [Candidatus Acidoferrum sp.]|nr:hypothetical protein [Candidatus Acidoferrum sp.]
MTRSDRTRRRMVRIAVASAALLSVSALSAPADAHDDHGRHHHDDGSFSFGLSLPGYYDPPPTYYYAPPPAYYAPPPAYYYPPAPPPRYYYDPGPSFDFGLSIGGSHH